MRLFGKRNKKRSLEKSDEPVLVTVISDTLTCEMYQNLLKENNIPFICRQQGAGGYLKHYTGGFLIADYIYVNKKDYDTAKELYDNYIDSNAEIEISYSEEN